MLAQIVAQSKELAKQSDKIAVLQSSLQSVELLLHQVLAAVQTRTVETQSSQRKRAHSVVDDASHEVNDGNSDGNTNNSSTGSTTSGNSSTSSSGVPLASIFTGCAHKVCKYVVNSKLSIRQAFIDYHAFEVVQHGNVIVAEKPDDRQSISSFLNCVKAMIRLRASQSLEPIAATPSRTDATWQQWQDVLHSAAAAAATSVETTITGFGITSMKTLSITNVVKLVDAKSGSFSAQRATAFLATAQKGIVSKLARREADTGTKSTVRTV